MPAGSLDRLRALFISRILLSFRPGEAQWRNLFILLTSVTLSARPLFCHFDRSEAQWRNLLVLLSSVKRFARDETNIAARNLHVRQNMFRKIRAAAAPSLSSSAENISPSKHVRSRHR